MSAASRKGASFERLIADYLAEKIDDRIDRRVKSGAKDRGDLTGWRYAGMRIVAELKNHKTMNLAGWIREAEIEAANDDAEIALVIHKRRGHAQAGDQYVTLTLNTLIHLLNRQRP